MDFSNVCRLCLNTPSSESDVFFPVNDKLRKKYKEITNTDMLQASNADENKRIPKSVCKPCLLDFDKFHAYYRNLMQKQEDLHNYLDLMPADTEETREDTIVPSLIENISQEHPVEEFQEDFEDSDQEVELDTSVKNEETTDAEMYYEETNEDEQNEYIGNYDYAPEDTMTSDQEEFDGNHLYTEEVEDEDLEGELADEYHLKIAGEEDEEFAFDNVILMDENSLVTKPKRKYERQTSSAEKSYKCWIGNCGSAFSNRQTMKKHMLQSHSLEVNKSTCMICGAKFDKYPDYLGHVKTHTRKFQCTVCKSTFTSFSVMNGHMKRAHSKQDNEQRIFACKVCDAKFKRKEHVNSHITYKHSDKSARKFSCKSCPSKFLTLQDLKNHEKSHNQVMIHCNYCNNKYRDRKSIVRHCLKIHGTTKIYKCSCDLAFEVFRDMQAHKKHCSSSTPDAPEIFKPSKAENHRKNSDSLVKRLNNRE